MSKPDCEHPELRPEDGKCSAEQIRKCHGKDKTHPSHAKDNKE
ncbi:MAG TPA: hypothetical protein VFC74_05200 [Oscillospiraceae bacterium]|nr:hypothetical protein [Oscillospiraceae bacterium]